MKDTQRTLQDRLNLGEADLAALARQGFVAADYLQRGGRRLGPYFKLRWRREGRQQVRYLGRDAELVQAVRRELARLQAARRLERAGLRQARRLRQQLRDLKQRLAPALAERGFSFHGYAARRRPAGAGLGNQ